MKQLLEGNHAVSMGVLRSRVQVIPAYPITPQTHISELLAQFASDGTMDARYIKVESEHSAMAACIGAATAGARTFTATSSQGLALMHELLHWAAGGRLPIVMACVNRTLGAPWNIWNDQSDSMSQRDTGWLQFYCEDNQDCVDSVLLAYAVAERVFTPAMIILDAFILSHTTEAVDVPDEMTADRFLPPLNNPHAIDLDSPRAFSPVVAPDHFTEVKYRQFDAARRALTVIDEENRRFKEIFGRSYSSIETYRTDGAETIIAACGAVCGTIRAAVDRLREEKTPVGMLKVRTFRPFPSELITDAVSGVSTVFVLDKSVIPGQGGPLAQEIRAALYDANKRPRVIGAVAGLGGRDITVDLICEAIRGLEKTKDTPQPFFLGMKK
ncbi:MAG: pyruvate ferredoxin oxidoreductase [Deltaproteobacteria bacterium]|nr:pyruvate ferredoxin oxidoreductase [Candidatus Zymogenaceae bacterium]